jgi:excisionase family DNA binding protein
MENLLITQLSEPQVRRIIKEEITGALSRYLTEQKANKQPEYMTINKLSKYINSSVSAIYAKVHRREIPYIKRGKRLLFNVEDIDKWLKGGRIKTTKEIINEASEFVAKKNYPIYK